MQRRMLGGLEVSAVGLGYATMTPFYGQLDRDAAIDTLRHAREIGDYLESSDAYGHGRNEELSPLGRSFVVDWVITAGGSVDIYTDSGVEGG